MRERLSRFYWWLEKKMVPGLGSSQYAYLAALVALELLWIKWIGAPAGAELRTNIIGVLRKPASG